MHGLLRSNRRDRRVAALLVVGSLAMLPNCARNASPDHATCAKVGGQPILREEVERIYHSRMTAASEAGSPEQALSFKLSILDELINKQILLDYASRSRIAVSEAEVDTKMGELQSPYSQDEFLKKMKEQGVELNDLRREVRQSLIINKLINKDIVSRITVTDAELAEYYARNKASFNVPETEYHVAQIEVTPRAEPEVRNLKNDDAKSPQAAVRKVQALYARLRTGEDFGKVAQEYSEDAKTAAAGGDMGFIPASSLNSNLPFKEALNSLKAGQISGIIQTPVGYHILKLLGREEAGQRPLSDPEVQSAIRQTLTNERQQLLKAAYIEVLRNKVKVTNYLAEQILSERPSNPASM